MTKTPAEQRPLRPSECKHYGYLAMCQKRCMALYGQMCLRKLGYQCPGYQPKEKKDAK